MISTKCFFFSEQVKAVHIAYQSSERMQYVVKIVTMFLDVTNSTKTEKECSFQNDYFLV